MLEIVQLYAFMSCFWFIYVGIMGIYRAHLTKRIRAMALFVAAPFVVIGYLIDVFANVILASLFFLDPPRELLFTSRLIRYKKVGKGLRFVISSWICFNLLDPFDPSETHCMEKKK
jgi:hypothetical protein